MSESVCYHCGGHRQHYPDCEIVPMMDRGERAIVIASSQPGAKWDEFIRAVDALAVSHGYTLRVGEVEWDGVTYDPSDGSSKGVRG